MQQPIEEQQDSEDSNQELHGYTLYQINLIAEAKDMWERSYRIPLHLYAEMAKEGLDVGYLEEHYYKEPF